MSWPQWPTANAAIPQGVQPPILNPAPAVMNPGTSVPGAQYTPEQWAQMQQQNWQQWAQWQQQFQQWQQQYGAEYQKSMNALAAQATPTPVQPPVPFFNSAPPLPTETKPPPPPEDPQVNNFTAPPPVANFSVAPPSQPPPNQPNYNQNQNNQQFARNQFNNNNEGNRGPSNRPNWQNRNQNQQQNWGKRPYQPPGDPMEGNKRNRLDGPESSKWQNQPKWEQPGWSSKPPPQPQETAKPPNPEELTEAEKKFDKQFADWESQFQKWKEQNANHPDKQQYIDYEKKWEAWRAQLLERREQMKRKRLGLSGPSPQPVQKPVEASIGPQVFPITPNKPEDKSVSLNRPPPNMNDQPLEFKKPQGLLLGEDPSEEENNESDFLKSNTAGGIPGLDLVKDGGKEEEEEEEKETSDSQLVQPDYDAISRGINNILGDQKLMNMLSMVSQNQSKPSTAAPINTQSAMGLNSPERNDGDQTRLSSNSESNSEFIWNNKNVPPPNFARKPPPFSKESDFYNRDEQGNFNRPEQGNFNRPEQGNFNRAEADRFDRPESGKFSRTEPGNFRPGPGNFNRPGPGNFNRPEPGNFNRPEPGNFNRPEPGNFNRFEAGNFNRPEPGNFNRPEAGNFNRPSLLGNFNRSESGNFNRPAPGNFNRPEPDNFDEPEPDEDDEYNEDYEYNEESQEEFRDDNFNRGGNFNKGGNFNRGGFNRGPNNREFGGNLNRDGNFNRGPGREDNFNKGPNRGHFNNFNREDRFQRPDNMQENFRGAHGGFNRHQDASNKPEDFQGPQNFRKGNFNKGPSRFGGLNFEPPDNFEKRPPFNQENFRPNDMNFNEKPFTPFREDYESEDGLKRGPPENFERGNSKFSASFDEESNSFAPPIEDECSQGSQVVDQGFNPPEEQVEGSAPEPLNNENAPPAEADDIWKPQIVTDYDHKAVKASEPDVIVEPIFTFDYRHKSLNRIPYPQRPRWLSEMVKNYPEFDSVIARPFEPQQLRRYPLNERYENRFEDRGRKFYDDFDNRKSYDRPHDRPNDRPSFEERERRPHEYRSREDWDKKPPYEDRERNYRDDWDRNSAKFDKYDDRREEERREKNERNFDRNERNSDRNERNFDRRSREPERSDDAPKNKFKENKQEEKAPSIIKSNVTLIEDLLCPPGRYNRPPRVVIILRGPPGSGKSFLAKLIKDKEVENGGSAPRILCLDDYFMVEQEVEVEEDGRKVKVKEMVYEYEECMEASYRLSLMKSFKKTITDGYFNFIVVDNINDKVKYFGEMWSFAKQNGFQVYICQLELDVQICIKRNMHGRSDAEIEKCVAGWEVTPSHHPVLDATSLIQSGSISEVEMEEINSPPSESANEEEHLISSKWDNFDYSVHNLAKLDGTNKPLRTSRTMEDYLQLDDDWIQPVSTKPGQKRVRWADLEERKQQEKMRAIGFVVGQTNWDRMMDPTMGGSALTQTKYIERY